MIRNYEYKAAAYARLIEYLIKLPDAILTLDREHISKACDVPMHMVHTGLLSLASNGALYQKGRSYQASPTLATLSGNQLADWVDSYDKAKYSRFKNKGQFDLSLDQPTAEPIADDTKYGYWLGNGFIWHDDIQSAVDSATAQAIKQGGSIDLVQRIGEINVKPTVKLF